MITLTTPSPAGAVAQGSSATPVFSCSDAGIGVQSCAVIGSGVAYTTSALGFHTFTVTGTDKLHQSSSASATYAVIRITTPALGATYSRTSVVNADFGCAALDDLHRDGHEARRRDRHGRERCPTAHRCRGAPTPSRSGRPTARRRQFSAVSYTVGPLSLTGKILFTRAGHIWAINPNGTGAVQLTSGLPIDDQAGEVARRIEFVVLRRASLFGGRPALGDERRRHEPDPADDERRQHRTRLVARRHEDRVPVDRAGSKGFDIWVGSWNPALGLPLTNLTNLPNTAGDDLRPTWSPTATGRIAFASNRKSNQFEIFTMKTDGTGVTQLTNDPGRPICPRTGRRTAPRSRSRAIARPPELRTATRST